MNGKFIVISRPDFFRGEAELINQLLEVGDFNFHLRKKESNPDDFKGLLRGIYPKYFQRIVIHQHFDLAEKFKFKGIHLTEQVRKNKMITSLNTSRLISTSIHDLMEYDKVKNDFDYIFFSPVFKSISKSDYVPRFSEVDIKNHLSMLNAQNIIALGGVEMSTMKKAMSLGFNGVAFLGSIWEKKSPVVYCRELLAEFKK